MSLFWIITLSILGAWYVFGIVCGFIFFKDVFKEIDESGEDAGFGDILFFMVGAIGFHQWFVYLDYRERKEENYLNGKRK